MVIHVAAIEAGGTKFNCAIVDERQRIVSEIRITTRTPAETLHDVVSFLRSASNTISAIGISSFGPIHLDPQSPRYGHITTTPKLAWSNCNLLEPLREFGVPLTFDTDVNGAAFGEWAYGAARGLDTFIYYTIGTGIGAGGMIGGNMMHGLTHPEAGHVRLPHNSDKDPFEGICPFHQDCFEGLASGPAMEKRWNLRPSELPAEHPAWELEAHYIALALANTICTLSPQKIILGGGVMQHELLFPLIRIKVQELLNGYIQHPSILDAIDSFIVPPALGSRSGVLGSAAMALREVAKAQL